MNASAQAHLTKAKEYVARGEQFYHLAAEQILAARVEGATWVECGDTLGRSDEWCKVITTWHESPANDNKAPWSFDSPRRKRDAGKQALRETPEVITELSVDEQRALARKLDEESAKRQKAREKESKRKEREHLGDEVVDSLYRLRKLQLEKDRIESSR